MNDTRSEDDLRAALLEISEDAPGVNDVLPAPRRASETRQRWLAPLAVAVIVAMVAVGIALAAHNPAPRQRHVAAASGLVGVHWTLDRVGTNHVFGDFELHIDDSGHLRQLFSACSGLTADAVVTRTRLTVDRPALTFEACAGSVSRNTVSLTEAAIRDVLRGTVSWRVDGQELTISRPDKPALSYVTTYYARHTRAFTYRGVGVVVPRSWVKNATDCGTPQKDTVVYPTPSPTCSTTSRPHVSAIRFDPLGADPAFGTAVAKRIRIDGVRALELRITPNAGSLAEPISVRLRILNCEITISSWSAREVALLKAGIYVVRR